MENLIVCLNPSINSSEGHCLCASTTAALTLCCVRLLSVGVRHSDCVFNSFCLLCAPPSPWHVWGRFPHAPLCTAFIPQSSSSFPLLRKWLGCRSCSFAWRCEASGVQQLQRKRSLLCRNVCISEGQKLHHLDRLAPIVWPLITFWNVWLRLRLLHLWKKCFAF